MSSTNAPNTAAAARTSTTTYTAPPSYTPSDTSSIKSTSSSVKKLLVSVLARKGDSSSTAMTATEGPGGNDGLTTEQKKIRNEARANYFATL